MAQPTKARVTLDAFLKMVDESDERMELVDGEVIVMGTPTPLHQDVVLAIAVILKGFTIGRTFVAPLEVVLGEDVVQPDVLYVLPDGKCSIEEKRLHGAPDLVVEVFSPATAKRDKSDKFRLYEAHGVQEYWMIDPIGQYIEIWRLDDDSFTQYGVFGLDEAFESPVLGSHQIHISV